MEKLEELKKQQQEIRALIKEEKQKIRAEKKQQQDGNWFTRWKRSYELKRYQQLQAKFGDVDLSGDLEQYLNSSLDRIESALDQAVEKQCSQQA